jgi:hypothetical protein
MGITRKTDAELPGPWLLDKDALLEFDRIIDEACERFEKLSKKEYERVVRGEYKKARESYFFKRSTDEEKKSELKRVRLRVRSSREFSERKRELVVQFKSDKKIPAVSRFSEAFSHPDMAKEVATHFDFTLVHGTAKTEVRTSTIWSDLLQINVSPSDGEGCYELFVDLHQWAERRRPHPLLVQWTKYAGLHWIVVFMGLYLISTIASAVRQPVADQRKVEAWNLLADGLTQEEEHRALELLLSLNSGFQPAASVSPSGSTWLSWLYGAMLLAGCIFSIAPRSRLAIGKGTDSIRRQRRWIYFVSKWLIGGIVLTLVTSYFREGIARLGGF